MANKYVTGLDEVVKNLNDRIKEIQGEPTLKGLVRGARIVLEDMEKTSPLIPVDTGNLRNSVFTVTSKGKVEVGENPTFVNKYYESGGAEKGNIKVSAAKLAKRHKAVLAYYGSEIAKLRKPAVVLGFSAYYAWYVHEMVGAHFKRPGAGAKFLEAAIKRNADKIIAVIQEEARIK